ncbi:MAG: DUF3303 domain-containing protein [Fimbriimonadales bacterium]
MVIEHYPVGNIELIGKRFELSGRMMPEGVSYHASWVDAEHARCFQVMEAPNRAMLDQWISNWADLVEFEIVPVLESGDFWTTRPDSSKPDSH